MIIFTAKKYRNEKAEADGILFDSKAERDYYLLYILPLMQKKKIENVKVHPTYLLQEGFTKYGHKIRKITYKADFEFSIKSGRKWKKVVVDVKGYQTTVVKLKRKLFDFKYPDVELKVVRQVRGGIFIEVP